MFSTMKQSFAINGTIELCINSVSSKDDVNGSVTIEDEEPFFHFDPVFVGAASSLPLYNSSHAWNKPREKHANYLRSTQSAIIFGANYVGCQSSRCFSESLHFRKGGLEFYRNILTNFHPGIHPLVELDDEYDRAKIFWSEEKIEEFEEIFEPVILLTPFEPDNWARWICHVIPRLVYVDRLGLREKLLVRSEKSWQTNLLAHFGFSLDRIISHDPGRCYFTPRVTFFQQSATDFTISAAERKIFFQIASSIKATGPTPDKLFISRMSTSAKAPDYRRLVNEQQLCDSFIQRGFAIFEPELYSFEDQVRWFFNATVVVGLGGSGMFNVIFCRPRTKVVTIESSPIFITSHTGLFASLNLWHGVIYGEPVNGNYMSVHENWRVDVDKVWSFLDPHL